MVAAGMGYSIVPASALTQSERLAAQVQQLAVPAFDGALNVWVIWSAQCKIADGTAEALGQIFAAAEGRSTLRLAPAAAIPTRRHRRPR